MSRYEGRELPRPDDELVDQGLGFDLGTLLDRRRMLTVLGAGVMAAGLAACSTPAPSAPAPGAPRTATGVTEIPDETAGPFPGDGSNGANILTESGVVRSDIRTSIGTGTATAQGIPTVLDLTVTDLAGAALPGAAVYVWQCDREGRYSMYSDGVENENYLRGVQLADATGKVRFTTVFPGCYPRRWPHVHFEVYPDQAAITDADNAIATSQLAFTRAASEAVYATPGYEGSVRNLSGVTLQSDSVFRDDDGARQLATMTGDPVTGYTAALRIAVDARA